MMVIHEFINDFIFGSYSTLVNITCELNINYDTPPDGDIICFLILAFFTRWELKLKFLLEELGVEKNASFLSLFVLNQNLMLVVEQFALMG